MAKCENSGFDISQSDPVSLKDTLQAFTAVNQDVVLLNYANAIIRRGYRDLSTVRLLSGGVVDAELTHAVCVGRGMLTAAIIGENATPNSRQILHTIKELNEGHNCGIIVIVQRNSDLFNFGLAAQRASTNCKLRIKLVTIDDDKTKLKQRYSCGFILLTKILGALAEEGVFFTDISRYCDEIVDNIVTVDLNYTHDATSDRKNTAISTNFNNFVEEVMPRGVESTLNLHPSVPVVALINTSRSLDRFTQLGLVKKVIDKISHLGIALIRIYYGSFVPLPLNAATLTVLKLSDNKITNFLDAKCEAAGWNELRQYLPEIKLPEEIPGVLRHQGKDPIPQKGPKLSELQIAILIKSVQFACDALISCERQLNIIDEEKSTGNVGSRLKMMAEHVNKRIRNKKLPANHPYTFLRKLGIIAEGTIGGTMGSIYGIFFESAANVFGELPESDNVSPFVWAKTLTSALEALDLYFPPESQNLSMFYPIKHCELALSKEMERTEDYLYCYECGVRAAEEKAQETRPASNKYPDAGAHAVGIWMRAVFEGIKLMSANHC